MPPEWVHTLLLLVVACMAFLVGPSIACRRFTQGSSCAAELALLLLVAVVV
jgi:hypothetical protein